MKIKEITQLNGQQLVESLAENNSTGCAPEDLAKVVEASRSDNWDDAIDGDEYLAKLRAGIQPWQM